MTDGAHTLRQLNQKVDELTKQNNRTQVLFESIDEKYQSIQEGIGALLEMPPRLERVEQDLGEIKTDIRIIKTVARESGSRITKLERGFYPKAG